MYIILAALVFIVLVALITVTGIYDFRIHNPAFLRDMQPVVMSIAFVGGAPFIILSFFKGIPANPATYMSLENPFVTQDQLEAHFESKLNEENYETPIVLADDSELRVIVRRKANLARTKVFVIAYTPELSHHVRERMQALIAQHLDDSSGFTENVFMTLVLGVEKGSKDYSSFVRLYGQSLHKYFIHVGFNFERRTMSFISRIDGFAAGKRKQILKAFLAMLPNPEKYSNLKKLSGTKSKVPPQ
jgi:hypothetical protein